MAAFTLRCSPGRRQYTDLSYEEFAVLFLVPIMKNSIFVFDCLASIFRSAWIMYVFSQQQSHLFDLFVVISCEFHKLCAQPDVSNALKSMN